MCQEPWRILQVLLIDAAVAGRRFGFAASVVRRQPTRFLDGCCRLHYSLTKGHCSKDCEDALQHMISVHIRSRYAIGDVVPDEMANFAYDGPEDHKASVFVQTKLSTLYDQYMEKVGLQRD